jgi:uncharacterized protein (TIGR02099 family)
LPSVSTVSPPAAPGTDRRRRRGLRLAWRVAFTLLLGAWSLLLLAWLTLQWGIVPRISEWKPEIEQKASEALGVPVAIGALRVRSSGWIPLIELDDVVLSRRPRAGAADPDAVALRLPRVHAALSARSLLGLQVRFEQLHIEGADLEVRRDTQGRLFVAGIEVRAGTPQDDGQGAGTDWLLAQRELVVRHGRVRWVDEMSGAAPLALTDVDVVMRNGLARHDIRLDATPPAQAGGRFTLMGRFTQPLLSQRSDWRRWHGTVYADLPQTDAAAVQSWLPPLPVQARAGTGALRAWIDVSDGRPQAVTADIALRDAALHFPGPDKLLVLDRLQGRIGARHEGRKLVFSADGLSFSAADVDWPATRLMLALREAEPVPGATTAAASAPSWAFDGGEMTADLLDLGALARMATQLPLGSAIDTLLADLLPGGRVRDLAASWDGPLSAPRKYRLKARAEGLTIAPAAPLEGHRLGRPGWRNADLDIDASETGGNARLSIVRGSIIVPGVFEQPEVNLDTFSTRLAWRIAAQPGGAPSAVEVSLDGTEFANADAKGQLTLATWHTGNGPAGTRGGRFPGRIDLAGQITRGNAAALARYLPLGVAKPARRYVERAVTAGRVTSASFRVRGDVWDFPYVVQPNAAPGGRGPAPTGEFRIVGRVEGVDLAYVPPWGDSPSAWPAFSGVSADLVVDRKSMEIRQGQARLWGLALQKVNGTIEDLSHPELRIEGQAAGPLTDFVRYVNASPVAVWTGQALREATASGNAELRLALYLPLAELGRSEVSGQLTLSGNDLRILPSMPQLAGTRARIAFTHKGLTVSGASARVLGGEATFEGSTQAEGGLRFMGQGVATAEGLRRATEFGSLARLASSATGQAPYRLVLGIARGRTEFTLNSPLTGMALDLPAPLRKPADASWPLRVETRFAPDAPTRETVRVELGGVLAAQYVREHSQDAPAQVLRGAIGVQEPVPPMPERGVHAVVSLGAVDADAWQAAIDRAPSNPVGGAGNASAAGDGYLPRTVALRAQSLVSGGRRLTNLVVGVSQDAQDGTWRGSLDADQLGGYVEYRAGRGPTQPGRVYARLARLALPPSDASSVESLLAEAPASVPALDIVIDNFELRGKKLGRVEVEAVNRGAREWRMTRFALTNPEAQLTGTGQWQAGGAKAQRMVMDFRLDLADSGAFLDRLGFPGTLRGGKGRLSGQVSWAGSPLAFHAPSLDGRLNLALDAGQFLKAGPGAGRLLSVLSLQSLPRRLALDFRDLFQEGFAFDNITGDVTVDDGVAATRNLRMRGVQAVVLMEGSADIPRETQDLRVVVVPEINAGTASLAYAAINPAVGLGTFLAQMFLRRPLMAAGTREFTVQGSWVDPKVERVERKLGEALPDLDAGAAPASAPVSAPAGTP